MKLLQIVLPLKRKWDYKMNYKVVEKFISINGEGYLAGQLAVFIRFAGCNLKCSYCDTAWANTADVPYELMTCEEIYKYIKSTEVKNVTLTGGEPLLQKGIIELLEMLSHDKGLHVEIETNGSIALNKYINIENPPSFTMDYKLPSSNVESKMELENLKYLSSKDTLKFVCGSIEDLEKAKYIIDKFSLVNKTHIYFSPVFGKINPETIVNFMKDNKMNGVNLQVQLHKIIWAPNERGV